VWQDVGQDVGLHLCKRNGVADFLKHATPPPHMCYHAEFGRSALKDVACTNTGEPQKLRSVGTPLSRDGIMGGDVADRKIHAPP